MTKTDILQLHQAGRRVAKDGKWLLRDITLSVAARNELLLTGPSGAGKSLLLRLVAWLDILTEGELLWHGNSIAPAEAPEYRSQIMYVPQTPSLGEGIVLDRLQQPFQLKTHSRRSFQREQVDAWLEQFGRGASLLHQETQHLSGGEQQIVQLIRALTLNPQVLLLDEPTAALDHETRERVRSGLRRWLMDDHRRALIWVAHDAEIESTWPGEKLRMRDGRLLERA